MHHAVQIGVAVFCELLFAALVIGIIAERIHIPYSVALLVASVPLQIKGIEKHFESSLLTIFLPMLIFEAAWNVDTRLLLRNWLSVFFMAVPGVVLTALLIAIGLSLFNLMPFLPAFLLGAILAATDPVAVIPILRKLHVPHELSTIIEGESLLNDGVAIALYAVLITALETGAKLNPLAFGGKGIYVSLGGALIGFVVAGGIGLLLRLTGDTLLWMVASVVVVFISYTLAEMAEVSGIFAVVVAGLTLRTLTRFPASVQPSDIGKFWAALAFFANTLVFLLMGIRINLDRVWHQPLQLLTAVAFVTFARLILAYVAFPLTKRGAPFAWRHVVALSGMRGAISIALALNIPDDIKYRPQIIDDTFGVVLITLVVQGLALGPVLGLLRPQLSAPATPSVTPPGAPAAA